MCHKDHLQLGMAESLRDLLEIVEDRYNAGSLIITRQLPADRRYELVGSPSLTDAILGRIVHDAFRLEGRRAGGCVSRQL